MGKPVYKWKLCSDYEFRPQFDISFDREYHDEKGRVWLTVADGVCTIHKGYSWDGCSPKYEIFGKVFGVWDGKEIFHQEVFDRDQQLKYASLIHDVFCQFFDSMPDEVTRKKIDESFYLDCNRVNFKLSWLYYQAVRFYSKRIRK